MSPHEIVDMLIGSHRSHSRDAEHRIRSRPPGDSIGAAHRFPL